MDKKTRAYEFGRKMEFEAREWFLERFGGRCVAANRRWKGGELDLVFEVPGRRGVELVFVEVRARHSPDFGGALGSLTHPKLRRLSRSVAVFLRGYQGGARSVRVDLLAWEAGRWIHLPNLWPLP